MSLQNPSTTKHSGLFIVLVSVLVLVALAAVCGFAYYFYLLMNDRLGTFSSAAHLADLDNDGDLDAVIVNMRKEAEFGFFTGVTTWTNLGGGQFTTEGSAGQVTPPEGEQFSAAALGDIENDGDTDVLTWDIVHLGWQVNQGKAQGGKTGTFKNMWGINSPERLAQFGVPLVGDLNNDGKLDGMLLGCCGRTFPEDPETTHPSYSFAWLNASDEDGWLTPQTSLLPALEGLAVKAGALGDLNGDGVLDLFAALGSPTGDSPGSAADRVFFNAGSGELQDSGQRLGDGNSTSVALGDVDADGDLDALVGTEYGSLVWFNLGGSEGGEMGTFLGSAMLLDSTPTRAVFLADLDGDGYLDAVLGGNNQATIWWNDGQAGFTPSGERFRYSKRHALAVGDFNNDGAPDLFAPVYAESYKLWLNDGNRSFELVRP
jgi:hypothetical protein